VTLFGHCNEIASSDLWPLHHGGKKSTDPTFRVGSSNDVWPPLYAHIMRANTDNRAKFCPSAHMSNLKSSACLIQWLRDLPLYLHTQTPAAHSALIPHSNTFRESKKVNTDIAVRNRNHHTATEDHMPYGITQCYLPPGSGDFPAFTPAIAGTRFSDPGGMQGWVHVFRGLCNG